MGVKLWNQWIRCGASADARERDEAARPAFWQAAMAMQIRACEGKCCMIIARYTWRDRYGKWASAASHKRGKRRAAHPQSSDQNQQVSLQPALGLREKQNKLSVWSATSARQKDVSFAAPLNARWWKKQNGIKREKGRHWRERERASRVRRNICFQLPQCASAGKKMNCAKRKHQCYHHVALSGAVFADRCWFC